MHGLRFTSLSPRGPNFVLFKQVDEEHFRGAAREWLCLFHVLFLVLRLQDFATFSTIAVLVECPMLTPCPGGAGRNMYTWGLHRRNPRIIRRQIQKYAGEDKRFFLTYVPAAPHYPYDSIPDRFRKYKVAGVQGLHSALLERTLLHMDWVITSIVDQLKESLSWIRRWSSLRLITGSAGGNGGNMGMVGR